MKHRFRRGVVILALAPWTLACSETAGAPGGNEPARGASPDAPTEARSEPEPAPTREARAPASDSEVPSPPGAKVVGSTPALSVTANGEKIETLPVVVLVSRDEVDEVAAFYEKELSGWQHEEFFGTHMFWKGEAEENSMAVMASMTRPFVAVQEFDAESDPRGAGDGKTTITVAYVPEK